MNIEKKCENCKKSSLGIRGFKICKDPLIESIYLPQKIIPYCYRLNRKNNCEQYKKKWFI